MKDSPGKGAGLRTLRAYLYGMILFGLLTIILGALLRFTPMPERWAPVYVFLVLCGSCFFTGFYGGSIHRRRGLLFGSLYGAGFLLLVLLINRGTADLPPEVSLFQPRFLICLVCGGVGGVMGTNLNK